MEEKGTPQEQQGLTPEQLEHAIRSGFPIGGPATGALEVSGELTRAALKEYALFLEEERVKRRIREVSGADPAVVQFALALLEKFGKMFERRGENLQGKAEERRKKANEHAGALMRLREKLEKEREEKRRREIAEALIKSLPPELAGYMGVLLKEGKGLESLKRAIAERWHELWLKWYDWRANSAWNRGNSYRMFGKKLNQVVEILRGEREMVRRLDIEELRAQEKELGEERERAQQQREALTEQFEEIIEKGPPLAQAAQIEAKQAESLKEQQEVFKGFTRVLARLRRSGGRENNTSSGGGEK